MHPNQTVLFLEGRVNFPINVFSPPCTCPDQDDGAGAAGYVILTDAPHDLVDVLTVDLTFQGIVRDQLIVVVESCGKSIAIGLVTSMVIAHEHLSPNPQTSRNRR